MKSFLKILIPAVALGVVCSPFLRAETDAGPAPGAAPSDQAPGRGERGPGGRGGRGGPMMDPAQRLQQLDAVLKLSEDQKAKITEIFKKEQEQMQSLRGGDTPRDQMRAKMEEIGKAGHDQIRALLTADQQKKFDDMPTPAPGRGGPGGPGGRRGGGERKAP